MVEICPFGIKQELRLHSMAIIVQLPKRAHHDTLSSSILLVNRFIKQRCLDDVAAYSGSESSKLGGQATLPDGIRRAEPLPCGDQAAACGDSDSLRIAVMIIRLVYRRCTSRREGQMSGVSHFQQIRAIDSDWNR